jgi:hypothetical protein
MRNSAHWLPDLKEMGRAFYAAKINKGSITYHQNNFAAIDDYCNCMVDAVRDDMYPPHIRKGDCLLDRHKIIAVHIVGELKNPIFTKDGTSRDESTLDWLANEYYCFLVLKVIMRAWYSSVGQNRELVIPDEYTNCLLKMFYKYRTSPPTIATDTTFIYALSNIVYLAEQCFLEDGGG